MHAGAQNLRDPAWESLLENDRHAELEAQARARLKAEPGTVAIVKLVFALWCAAL